MMTKYREPDLHSLFDQANRELQGESITARVVARTRTRVMTRAGLALVVMLLFLLVAWQLLALPLLEFAVLVSQLLTNPLVDLGEGWVALAFLPVNNFASLLVLSTKGVLIAWKKLTGSSLIR
ncbi:MAG: hypothetical protein HKO85_07685 [Xanthomonadales bacterium]|nr:hypothetical protein [Gammaproteobacteria bacterium]MBT8049645.1 hypothetical protein [Gammaproteobacteria bacterium]MBT8055787.1 hypothetical protein [Gammaproteobacteria bacterium]NNJ80336.1 hypothetical protein [Xanthomonadales bacterium]NNL05156.1 hypothetical protein [Xanthomonadales bacterium]